MTKEYDNTNTASVWANPGALENEQAPVLRVKLNVDGVDKEVGLYLNENHDDYRDLNDLIIELLEIIQESSSSSPIFRGKVKEPYRKAEGKTSKRGKGRRDKAGSGSPVAAADSGDW